MKHFVRINPNFFIGILLTYSKPKKGTALLFFPSAGGIPNTPFDIRTLHAGEAVAASSTTDKWIAQLWLRQKDGYKPSAPPGNTHESGFDDVSNYCLEYKD